MDGWMDGWMGRRKEVQDALLSRGLGTGFSCLPDMHGQVFIVHG